MAIKIEGLDHIVLRVKSVDRALRFYRDVLGCREERRVDSIGLVQLRAGRSLIDLVPAKGAGGKRRASAANMDHFALRVARLNAPALRRYLRARGVKPGEIASRYGAEGEGPSMYITDPDGNMVELKGPPARPRAGRRKRRGKR
ncbi:MAG: VOC family protein [Rhodospirillales bacterium]|nr:VOC family protein [Rhodospirillales bacterium]